MIIGWTVLQRSKRELQLWGAAAVLMIVCCGALVFAALMRDPRQPLVVWTAVLLSATAAIWTVRSVPRSEPGLEIAIGADGALQVRRCEGGADEPPTPARCIFVAPWLITLRCGGVVLPIWPDSLPAPAFRRLHACTRWDSSAEASTRRRRAQSNDEAVG